MTPDQPRKLAQDLGVIRELEVLHGRINDLILNPALASLAATKANYAAGDVGTAADIATALNTIAAAVNTMATEVNSLAAKLNRT